MIIDLAVDNNCWIQHGRNWFTPYEFADFYGKTYNLSKDYIKIRNPLVARKQGRKAVLNQLLSGLDKLKAYDIVSRLIDFEEKIEKHKYTPLPDQQDEILIS